MVVVLFILAVMATFAVLSVRKDTETGGIAAFSEQLTFALRYARQTSIVRNRPYALSVHSDGFIFLSAIKKIDNEKNTADTGIEIPTTGPRWQYVQNDDILTTYPVIDRDNVGIINFYQENRLVPLDTFDTIHKPHIMIFPTGEITPFELVFISRPPIIRYATITSDGSGIITVTADE